ncbi:MAG TPA: RagB/SusD family nutrient uptake outer membrane protein [Paludibacteraceae bacterium]|nr:RagB/SusD family nutrient uptake outer membrane protein [Paludibacteraceae bacterium]
MKKFNVVLMTLLVIFFISCSDDFLNKNPLDTFTNDNFWTSENNVSGYANTFYENFLGYGNAGGAGNFYFKTLSDDQAGNEFAQWTYINVPASSSTWKNGWIEIRRANILLENVDKVPMSDAAKNHWKGVGRLMRAWQYYQLIRAYGDVPWIDKSLDITDEGYLYGPRNNRDEVMNNVLADLNFACDNMYDNTSKITLNRNVAYAMKAEICLFEGTFRKYRNASDGQSAPDLTGSRNFLTQAKNAASYLMGKGFSLNASYQGNYNSVDLSKNPEMIMYKPYKLGVLQHSTIDYTCSSTQISGMTKNAFESYLFLDGKPASLTNLDNTDAAEFKIGTKVVAGQTVPDTILSITKILSLRDKRLVQTLDTALCYVGRGFTRFGVGMSMTSSTGYGICKYDNKDIPVQYRNQTNSNYTHAPLFWLAVVYLQYAEACAELGEITQDDLNNSINKLKDRAGLPHLTVDVGFSDPANNMEVSDLIWEIRRERRCELMFDNWTRYWDLIRWHQLDKLDSSQHPDILLGANIVNDPYDNAVPRVGNYIDGSKGKTRIYEPKHYWYPIPSDQLSLNPQLGQNSGWQ